MRFKRFFWNIFFSLLLSGALCVAFSFFISRLIYNEKISVGLAVVSLWVVTLAISYLLSRVVYRPIRLLESRMSKMAEKGMVQLQARESKSFEIYDLARSIDSISNQLTSRIDTVLQQKNEQEAVFSSMGEGVVALDSAKNILHMNRSASQLLGLDRSKIQNQNVVEIIRVPEILDLIQESLDLKKGGEREIELPQSEGVRFMQVRARPLLQPGSNSTGLVLVLSDITRMRELEGMRKTFVANVSHELRTPLTSIQGFAETLLNPAVQDPQEMKKHVAIIQKHASRLNQIIEDLLALSRLEKDIEDKQIELKPSSLLEVVKNAVEVCQVTAQAKNIQIEIQHSPSVEVAMDRSLIEQAIVNLIDNAIRYSNERSRVLLAIERQALECRVDVSDQGVGIPEKHLSRIFERFYRVDKARGRDVGGTGLGLSIVKYIAQAHRGRVEVKSQLGQGSTFSLVLPLKNRES